MNEVGVLLGRSLLGRIDIEMGSLKLISFSVPCDTLEGFHTPSENTVSDLKIHSSTEYKKWNFRVRTSVPLTFNILRSDFMSSFQFSYLLAVNECSLCTTSLPIFKIFFSNLMGVTCYLFIIFTFSSLLLTLGIFLYLLAIQVFSSANHMLFILSFFFLLFPYVCIYIYVYTYTHTYFYLLSLLQIFYLIPCLFV